MKYVTVVFEGSARKYTYKTKLNLKANEWYIIENDKGANYSNTPVKVLQTYNDENTIIILGDNVELREIVDAKRVTTDKRKKDALKRVVVKPTKGTVTVTWTDNVQTTVTCHKTDRFDFEKAIMACYLKRMTENKSYFNDFIDKAEKMAEWVI